MGRGRGRGVRMIQPTFKEHEVKQFLNEIQDYSSDVIEMVISESLPKVSVACSCFQHRH